MTLPYRALYASLLASTGETNEARQLWEEWLRIAVAGSDPWLEPEVRLGFAAFLSQIDTRAAIRECEHGLRIEQYFSQPTVFFDSPARALQELYARTKDEAGSTRIACLRWQSYANLDFDERR